MVQGEPCLKPPSARERSAELSVLQLFKVMCKPETALLYWGKPLLIMLLPLGRLTV